MEKQFVTYEIALKLKELGFDEECFGEYHNTKIIGFENDSWIILNENLEENMRFTFVCTAPLWQQVIDWLVEKYNIYIDVKPVVFDDEPIYIYEIVDLKKGRLLNNINESFIDPNEAREQAILKAIELCQKEES